MCTTLYSVIRRWSLKAEAGEAAWKLSTMSDAWAAELKAKLQNRRADQDIMDMRLEEANQVLGIVHLHLLGNGG